MFATDSNEDGDIDQTVLAFINILTLAFF